MKRSWLGLGLLLLLLGLAACRREAEVGRGPVVLITCDSLRADVVGAWNARERGLTPNLDALIREASWSGPAIASSSSDAPAMASLLTGLSPWQHQVLFGETPQLNAALETLPEALKRRGYETVGFSGNDSYSKETGYGQGFDRFEKLGKGEEAEKRLQRLDRTFVWIHLPEPQAPYLRRHKIEQRLGGSALSLPQRILPNQLAPFFDPSEPLPPGKRRRFWAMYRYNVAFADDRLGRLLAALRASGNWERSLIVVTSTHGEEFGEKGQILNGGNLGRRLIEVPLVVKLPQGVRRPLVAGQGERPAADRTFATIVEAAGGQAPAAAAPSLFRNVPAGALSELYRTNGANLFSWVEGRLQLLWESRFAAPEPEYYRALLARMARGNALAARAELREPPEAILDRLAAAFRRVPPLAGLDRPRLILERWTDGGTAPLVDEGRAAEMAAALAAAWNRFQPAAEAPVGERRE